jgi:hypothetical protein
MPADLLIHVPVTVRPFEEFVFAQFLDSPEEIVERLDALLSR